MKPIPFPQVLAMVSLAVLLVLAVDTFVLPPDHIREVYDRGYTVDVVGGGIKSHVPRTYTLNYILARSGDKYHIPYDLRNSYSLGENDTFYIDRSRLLRQPLTLYYPGTNGFVAMHMEVLNGNIWGQLIALIIILLTFAQMIPGISPDQKETYGYVSFAMAVFLGIYYFYH